MSHASQLGTAMSPARRVRRASMQVSVLISVLAFLVIGGTILLDQWIAGYASGRFILGTAILSAGACVGLFAIVAGIGSAISIALAEEARTDTPHHEAPPARADAAVTGEATSNGEPLTHDVLPAPAAANDNPPRQSKRRSAVRRRADTRPASGERPVKSEAGSSVAR
jgi:hypothetical protein